MSKKTTRRNILKTSGAALFALAPGVRLVDLAVAAAEDGGKKNLVRWGMLIDVTKCADGCTDCVDACNEEHGLNDQDSNKKRRAHTDAQYIRSVTVTDKQNGVVQNIPMLCQHCDDAPCVKVCPTGASFQRQDGIVLVDKHTCIGCRYCMLACPYKARSFVHETLTGQVPSTPRGKGTVESCNFCSHRVDRGGSPACVETCNVKQHNALVFGDMNDAQSELSRVLKEKSNTKIRSDLGLNTGVRYHGIT